MSGSIRKVKKRRENDDNYDDNYNDNANTSNVLETKKIRICDDHIKNFYTLLLIGETGAGKSQLGNAYLRSNVFTVDDDLDSETFITSSNEKEIDGVIRCVIDTQGLDDTQRVDEKHIQQMVSFMRKWNKGVNAVGLIINGQQPHLSVGTQKLVQIVDSFFNNPEFWNHFCLIFTRSYKEYPVNEQALTTKYREKIQQIIVKSITPGSRPQIPVFFVDSKKFDDSDDIKTKNNLAALHAFVIESDPLSTQNVVIPFICKTIKTETKDKVKIKEEIRECGENKRR
jgi:predicted GTPase